MRFNYCSYERNTRKKPLQSLVILGKHQKLIMFVFTKQNDYLVNIFSYVIATHMYLVLSPSSHFASGRHKLRHHGNEKKITRGLVARMGEAPTHFLLALDF